MKRQAIKHHMDGLLMLLLFGVFAACVLVVLMTGARAYRRLTQRDQAAYDRRTCAQYIATRVRQGDQWGGVRVEPFEETTALALSQDGFVTLVYWYDGYLMELYTTEGAGLLPQDGEKIMPLDSLTFMLDGGLLTAEIGSGEGRPDVLRLSLRSGEGAAG